MLLRLSRLDRRPLRVWPWQGKQAAERLDVYWLLKVEIAASRARSLRSDLRRPARDGNDCWRWSHPISDSLSDHQPVDFWQPKIKQHNVRLEVAGSMDSAEPIMCDRNGVAFEPQEQSQRFRSLNYVVDDEDAEDLIRRRDHLTTRVYSQHTT
jgi:hypothetical protein